MRKIVTALVAAAALVVLAAPAQALTLKSSVTHAPNLSVLGVEAPSTAATINCGSAGNYDIFVSFNEAYFIATVYGSTLQGPFYWDSCAAITSQNRTYVKWHYPASGGRIVNMEGYLYDRFDSNSQCPGSHSPDLGNVSWAMRNANGTLVSSSSIGTYATPCE